MLKKLSKSQSMNEIFIFLSKYPLVYQESISIELKGPRGMRRLWRNTLNSIFLIDIVPELLINVSEIKPSWVGEDGLRNKIANIGI